MFSDETKDRINYAVGIGKVSTSNGISSSNDILISPCVIVTSCSIRPSPYTDGSLLSFTSDTLGLPLSLPSSSKQ